MIARQDCRKVRMMPSFPSRTFERMGASLLLNIKTKLDGGKDAELVMEVLGLGLL